jgi:hypothetical protein
VLSHCCVPSKLYPLSAAVVSGIPGVRSHYRSNHTQHTCQRANDSCFRLHLPPLQHCKIDQHGATESPVLPTSACSGAHRVRIMDVRATTEGPGRTRPPSTSGATSGPASSDTYSRLGTSTALGRGALAGWAACPLCPQRTTVSLNWCVRIKFYGFSQLLTPLGPTTTLRHRRSDLPLGGGLRRTCMQSTPHGSRVRPSANLERLSGSELRI